MITQEVLKEYFLYDPESGHFTIIKKIPYGKFPLNTPITKARANGYIYINFDYRQYPAHRLAFLYMTGEFPELVDHIDNDRTNNSWSNLREANATENSSNQVKRVDNTSGIKGVSWSVSKRKWRSYISHERKCLHLGYFTDLEEAALAVKSKREELHKAFHNHG